VQVVNGIYLRGVNIMNPIRKHDAGQASQRVFPPAARRPLNLAHMRSAHASSAGTFLRTRSFVTDELGARLIRAGVLIVFRGQETTRRAVNVLERHAAAHAKAKADGCPTHEPPPVAAERRAA
jgi:hypothetical protein